LKFITSKKPKKAPKYKCATQRSLTGLLMAVTKNKIQFFNNK